MKKITLTLILASLLSGGFYANEFSDFKNDKDKKRKKKEEKKKDRIKNFHSVNRWKITVDYTNGERISKTIVVPVDSQKSGLETAFEEAAKYLRNSKKIKQYRVTPLTSNSYMLLAGGE